MFVRVATRTDARTIQAFFEEGDRYHYDRLKVHLKSPDQSVPNVDQITAMILNGEHRFWLALLEEQAVGMLHAVCRDVAASRLHLARRVVTIEEIVVAESQRNRGAGKRLMQEAESWSLTQQAESIELRVFTENQSAIRLYTKLGWMPILQLMRKDLG